MRRLLLILIAIAAFVPSRADAQITGTVTGTRLYALPTVTNGNITGSARFLVDSPSFTPTGGKALTPNELKLFLNVGTTSTLTLGSLAVTTLTVGGSPLSTIATDTGSDGYFQFDTVGGGFSVVSPAAGNNLLLRHDVLNGLTIYSFTGGRSGTFSPQATTHAVNYNGSRVAVFNSTTFTNGRVVFADSQGKLLQAAVTGTDVAYMSGVTSSVQTQLDGKQAALTSTSAITLGGVMSTTIDVSGLARLGTLSVTNGIASGTLSVSGASTFGGAMQVNNNLTATGAVTLSGNVTMSGNATLLGTLTNTGLQTSNTIRVNFLGIGTASTSTAIAILQPNNTQTIGLHIPLTTTTQRGIQINAVGAGSTAPFSILTSTGSEIYRLGYSASTADFITDGSLGSTWEVRRNGVASHFFYNTTNSQGYTLLNAAAASTGHTIIRASGENNMAYFDASTARVGIRNGTPASTFDLAGSFGIGNGVITTTDLVINDTTAVVTFSGAVTMTMPSALTTTRRAIIFTNDGAVTGTVTGTASQTLQGSTTLSVPAGGWLRLYNNNGAWKRAGGGN